MDKYLINDLERLTGVKAHTIRIWEKRYNIIEPSRTDTNRRFYNGIQLRKLMNISTLLANGHKISQVASLSIEELNQLIGRLHLSKTDTTVFAAYIHDLTEAMFTFDEPLLNRVFKEVNERFGLAQGMMQIFYPFLRKTGVLWRTDKTTPVEEHFAVNVIRRKIVATTEALPEPDTNNPKFLLFLPPDEWHEIALLFANYLIRSHGYPTIYLGQNVPLSEVRLVSEKTNTKDFLLFYIAPRHTEDVLEEIRLLSRENPNANIYISGSLDFLHDVHFNNNIHFLPNVEALLNVLA